MSLSLKLRAGTVPSGQNCLSTVQDILNKSAKYLTVEAPLGTTVVIVSESQPVADDQDKVWIRLESSGDPNGEYVFTNGDWKRVPALEVNSIIFFSGLCSAVPDGWHLCDGTDGAPDLTAETALWTPNYTNSDPSTNYTAAPIIFQGY